MNKTVVKYLLAAVCAAALAAPASAAPKEASAPAPAPLPRVEVAVVKRMTKVEQGISTTSTLKALEEVIINPKVTARISTIGVDKGNFVKAGDTLVSLDSRTPEAEYASLKAQVAVNKAELEQSKVSLADAKREYERYGRLRKSGASTQQEYDTRNTTYQAAIASNAKAAAQVQMAQANLDAQAVTLSEYQLLAPITGVVLDDYDLTVGTLVKTDTNVLRIGSVNRLKACVDIPERDMGRLRLDMEAQLTFESLPNEMFFGRITLIDPYINTSTRTIGAEITIDNRATGYKLKPGMFCRVLLVESTEENPLVIPTEALRGDGTVMVVRDGHAVLQQVTTGATRGGLISVSSGLTIGEDVVVSGGRNVNAGDEVEFVITSE